MRFQQYSYNEVARYYRSMAGFAHLNCPITGALFLLRLRLCIRIDPSFARTSCRFSLYFLRLLSCFQSISKFNFTLIITNQETIQPASFRDLTKMSSLCFSGVAAERKTNEITEEEYLQAILNYCTGLRHGENQLCNHDTAQSDGQGAMLHSPEMTGLT